MIAPRATTRPLVKMGRKEWCRRYQPVLTRQRAVRQFGWTERDGDDLALLHQAAPNTVWTCVDADGRWYLVEGVHYVNRVFYAVTTVPWTEGTSYEIQW